MPSPSSSNSNSIDPKKKAAKQEKLAARMKDIASELHRFNTFCREHRALAPVVLPIRDGLSLCRFSVK